MSSGLAYAFAAMLFFGIGDLIYKRGGLAGAPPHQLLMVQSWVFLPSVVLFGLFSGALALVPATLWGALAGLFMTIGFYNCWRPLRPGPPLMIRGEKLWRGLMHRRYDLLPGST